MTAVATQRVYLFEEGDKSMRDLLGGKGANLSLLQIPLRAGRRPVTQWIQV